MATKDGECIRAGEYVVQTWTFKVQEKCGDRNNVESHGITKGEHNWRSMSSSVLDGVKEGDKFTFIHNGVQYTSMALQKGSKYERFGTFEEVYDSLPKNRYV